MPYYFMWEHIDIVSGETITPGIHIQWGDESLMEGESTVLSKDGKAIPYDEFHETNGYWISPELTRDEAIQLYQNEIKSLTKNQ